MPLSTTQIVPESPAPARPRTDQLEIVVSLQDIRDGVQGIGTQCAVAIALHRAGHQGVHVGHSGVYADGIEYVPTAELRHWIGTFDCRRAFAHPDRWVLSPRDQGGAAS